MKAKNTIEDGKKAETEKHDNILIDKNLTFFSIVPLQIHFDADNFNQS